MRNVLISIALVFITLTVQAHEYLPALEDMEKIYKPIAVKAGIRESQFLKALNYYKKHFIKLGNTKYISFIDFSKPSSKERLYILNLENRRVSKFLVSHGMKSGELYATEFSNTKNSHKSSLGMYIIQNHYYGKHGKSLYMDGLEKSNSNARDRNIVMHAADYVSQATVNKIGYLGRSHGCPAMNPKDFKLVVDRIKNGSILLAYK